jgi:hypothetical protein
LPRRRPRKQRVVLRTRRRVALQKRMSGLMFTAGLIGILAIFLKVASSETSWAPKYMRRHTPVLQVQSDGALADLPLVKQTQPASIFLWLPGVEWRMERRWKKDYPAIRDIRFEKNFSANRVIAHLEPRVPLARWEERGIDKNGVVFTLASPQWAALPKVISASAASLPALGRWLAELSQVNELWPQVVAVSQDPRGDVWLDTQTGTHIAWGVPDTKNVREKARSLVVVLNDAHQRLSGASTADLRFFEEGRVIVRPKTAI